jgi:DNA-directed RNA polymerase specialized sigma24 family protein
MASVPRYEAEFLRLLDADAGAAEEKYRTLRRKLICFFRQWNCTDLENLADETIHRAHRKWVEGAEISGLSAYCYGIAKNLRLEVTGGAPMEVLSEELRGPAPNSDRVILLTQLLDRLAQEDGGFILEYFRGDRKDMAGRLGLTPNALRLRAFRILKTLRAMAGGLESTK